MPALTKRTLDAAEPQPAEYFMWCGSLAGFGARIYPTGRKVFVAQVRVGRRTRRIKIGSFGAFAVEQARERAMAIIRAAADGRDPQREKREERDALTVAEICDQYLEAARAGLVMTRFKQPKRASTLAIDEGRISRHIVPLIGTIRARDLRRADLQRMADAIASGKTAGVFKGKTRGRAVVAGGAATAARVVELLGGIYTWAEKRDLAPGPNPIRGVETARGQAKDRVLSADELDELGRALRQQENESPVAALRLIALTGLQKGEACGLKWDEIDETGQCLRLENTKTGRSTRPIGRKAVELLRSLPREDGIDWVFPRSDRNGSADLKKAFAALFDVAGLTEARCHDLRRTFASVAADLGFGDATIAELLGHARRGVTARHYIRRPDAALVAAANKISARIAAALDRGFSLSSD
jgi:integrase